MEERPEACFGLAAALWWSGETRASVAQCTRAYSLFRQRGDTPGAVECAVWLAITYKANFANFAAANGWVGRAERLLEPLEVGPAPRLGLGRPGLPAGRPRRRRGLTERAARRWPGTHATSTWSSSPWPSSVSSAWARERRTAGFALIDEAMAAALAGERASLDTVVYTACDMLNACELASDLERAEQWCRVADDFVATYGCPFLYAECRLFYGGVLVAKGRWADAELELAAGLRITEGACPAPARQGAHQDGDPAGPPGAAGRRGATAGRPRSALAAEADAEVTLTVSALLLARGDSARGQPRVLERRHHLTGHRSQLATALDHLVDAYLAAGDLSSPAGRRPFGRLGLASPRSVPGRIGRDTGRAPCWRWRAGAWPWPRATAPRRSRRARPRWPPGPGRTCRSRRPGRGTSWLAPGASDGPTGPSTRPRLALASFEDLGATLEADRTAALLRAMGVTARTGAKGVGTLTNREQEVLALLGHGLSNPEIAAAPAREPQDRVAPRQQRPVQAEPAQPGRGGGVATAGPPGSDGRSEQRHGAVDRCSPRRGAA